MISFGGHSGDAGANSGSAPGTLVELTKVRAVLDAEVQPGNWESYPIGSGGADTSLPVDYVLVGTLIEPPRVGGRVRILRFQRNGVDALGLFESTIVTQVTFDGFTTCNSVYRMRPLDSED
jgi:hypothetical protein